jgi:putative ABC transport system substrate-binding protein
MTSDPLSNRRTVVVAGLAALGVCQAIGAIAQQPAKRFRIGILGVGTPEGTVAVTQAFEQAMRELGYVDGGNIAYEYRWARGVADRLPALAAELVHIRVDLIVVGTNAAIAAAKQATSTIPIVMVIAVDPVRQGFIESHARPGGNITGQSADTGQEMQGKMLQLLKEIVPALSAVGVLAQKGVGYDPAALAAAARLLGLRLEVSDQLRTFDELEAAFAAMKVKRIDAYYMLGGAVLFSLRQRIMELALLHRLPGIHPGREWVEVGGLIGYGANLPDLYRRAAVYVGKILKGAMPAELAVEQPARFDLAINLKTARTLGLTIPQSLLLRADDVIQ